MPEDFDPRQAALQYAASVEAYAERTRGTDDQIVALAGGEALHAVVCGLLYVGDQIREAHERPTALQLVLPNAEAVSAWRALEDEPVMSKRVKLVSTGFATLEVDGMEHELATGDSLEVPLGIKVTG